MSYTTAFMESLTICGFPYYKFANVHMAYTLGSAFYAIYFLVSFPMFLRVDENPRRKFTLFQTAVEALASSMAVLCLLDFVRLYLGVPLFSAH
jgi:cycloeucalenol cycloisomerase